MFASDAIEHLEADQEYHMWLNAITYVKKDKDLIRELKKANKVLMKRVNEESKDTFKKVNEKKGIIETERVIYSEDGSTKMGVVKEQFARVTKRKSTDAENIDPHNQKKTASDQRHQTVHFNLSFRSFTIMGSWRRSDNLRFFGLVRFSERSGVASSFSPFSPLSITMKPALFLIVFPVVFFDNLLTKESGFCFPEVLSSGSISWAGSLCTCFLCIFNPFLEVFFLPHILHL